MIIVRRLLQFLVLISGGGGPFVHGDCELESVKKLHEKFPEWQPNAIIDVGANHGCWTIYARELFPKSKFLMLEAYQNFSTAHQDYKDKSESYVDYDIQVMSSKDGEEVKFWAEGTTGNSMFYQFYGGIHNIEPTIRITKRLDTVLQESFLKDERVDLIKLDVQGSEHVVLQGATKLLQEATFVQLESSAIEYNKGGACSYEVDLFLRQHGFYLYDLGDVQRDENLYQSHGAGQFDALYIRPASEHLPEMYKKVKPRFCGSDRAMETTVAAGALASSEESHACSKSIYLEHALRLIIVLQLCILCALAVVCRRGQFPKRRTH